MLKDLCKRRKKTLFVLALLACALGWAYLSVQAVPAQFQRVFLPPAQQVEVDTAAVSNAGLRELRTQAEALDDALDGSCELGTLYSLSQPQSVGAENAEGVNARVVGIDARYFGTHEVVLHAGRLPYPDELTRGEPVALIEEGLAVALFQYAEPVEKKIVIGTDSYRIIGILRKSKQVGDQMDYSAYVPLRALENSATALTAMVYEAKPVAGAGGWLTFESSVASLGQVGTTISLSKERVNAALPLRMLLVALGFWLGLSLLKLVNQAVTQAYRAYREKLTTTYATHLLWWLTWRGMLAALCYAACVFLLAQVFVVLIDPVYTFPEWIPAVLVEPSEIATAFWNVWQTPATPVELRTPELLRLRFLRELITWCSAAFGMLAVSLFLPSEKREPVQKDE